MSVKESNMQALLDTSYLGGGNAAYIEDLYEQYLHNPNSLDDFWRNFFATFSRPGQEISYDDVRTYFKQLARQPLAVIAETPTGSELEHERKQVQVYKLIDAYRTFGHYRAQLDPLNLTKLPNIQSLELVHYGLTTADLHTQFNMNGFFGVPRASLQEIYAILKRTYCDTLGVEYKHIADQEQIDWIQQRLETVQSHPHFSAEKKRKILETLIEAEGLERYLGTKYIGQTRFSIEGGESLMPLLNQIILSCSKEVKELVIGMGHRGRLNVLVNLLGKSPSDLFREFEGKHREERSGDVKYHMGFASDIEAAHGVLHLVLAFNPSHLEIIDPVVEGSVRSRQERRDDVERDQVIPLLIHGDAAFAGQGVVMETFSLSETRGYTTGGTVHVVVNNQIGFTTSNPQDARSSWYCTDVAKMVEAPIFHVNGDDPEAVVFAAQLAQDYRMRFKRDVVIDLVCYRRHGHNEGDEPAATQPVMYRRIKQHPSVVKLYADRMIAENLITQTEFDDLIIQYRNKLDTGETVVKIVNGSNHNQFAVDWKPYEDQDWTVAVDTGIPLKKLQTLAQRIETLPAGFELQPQVAKMMEDRRKMTAGTLPLNWGYAETMAYAALLSEGYLIRISGEDIGRGTFAHRHAVLHDYQNDEIYIPLKHVAENQGHFSIYDSVLSEEAVLGFEYGYASADPNALVIWEAQYGDFANGAQVVIDQFISSGEQKWGRLCGLTLFLPHGYEGAGPEHSSARLERFLQLCAEHNMQVCMPTTPAQIFHLIRRQMIRPYRKPLVVMTPKSLLRHKLATSSLSELTDGKFQNVIPEIEKIDPSDVKRIVLCSGKVYYDLLEQRNTNQQTDIAIIRIEQLYPFPEQELVEQLQQYKKAKKVIWCQEEPKNQGAWYSTYHHLTACLIKGQSLEYAGRIDSASPAAGSKSLHTEQQKTLVNEALN